MNASIIGVPPAAHLAALGSVDGIAAFQRALADELNQASAGGSASGLDLSAETNALASNGTLKTAERLDALRFAGLSTANGLDATLQGLIAAAAGDAKLAAVSVDGRTVASSVLGLLNSAEGQVQTVTARIQADTLVDVLRTDNLALASLRVHGFVDEQAHLLIAAGDTLYETSSLGQTRDQILGQITGGSSASDANYGAELNAWNQLRSAISATGGAAVTAVRVALSLDSAGYPGNQGTLAAQRQVLVLLPNGALNNARTSVVVIRNLLAQRHQ